MRFFLFSSVTPVVSSDVLATNDAYVNLHFWTVTDSTYRLASAENTQNIGWWFLCVGVDTRSPDCENDFDNRPFWKKGWACSNSSVMGDAWKIDGCGATQIVLEKVD